MKTLWWYRKQHFLFEKSPGTQSLLLLQFLSILCNLLFSSITKYCNKRNNSFYVIRWTNNMKCNTVTGFRNYSKWLKMAPKVLKHSKKMPKGGKRCQKVYKKELKVAKKKKNNKKNRAPNGYKLMALNSSKWIKILEITWNGSKSDTQLKKTQKVHKKLFKKFF